MLLKFRFPDTFCRENLVKTIYSLSFEYKSTCYSSNLNSLFVNHSYITLWEIDILSQIILFIKNLNLKSICRPLNDLSYTGLTKTSLFET